ncbi:hypothetical protein BDW02DRAFT_608730 [Decorospora gaudefroyi]|uniref:Uncharacterized protein n=1 Tax=Decorospora gaudefroyi TaxID=184978 RepID=A0A6A5K130_9PLEO|nr:hypothetical protein BDW02DRAFT_608730 [Decorospora gaudefroyi]
MLALRLILCIFISTFSRPSSAKSVRDAVPNAQLMPDRFSAFDDYEVLNVYEEGDEDVVHIRKRVDDDDEECENDCLNYSSLNENGFMQCIPEDDIPHETGKKTRSNVRKNPRLGLYHRVYDIGDPSEPLKPEWFRLKRHRTKWSKNIRGVTKTRCYSAEHVVEWQLLANFIKADKNRCVFLLKHFGMNMPMTMHKVQVAKNNGELKSNGRAEYETKDYDFSKFPTTNPLSPPNPWEHELVLINQDANNKKSNIWTGANLFREPQLDANGKLRFNLENGGTLEANFANQYYENGLKKTWQDNRGRCKAVHMFMTLMKPFQYRGLQKEWLDWMVVTHKNRLDGLNKALADHVDVFKGKSTIIPKLKRWDYTGIFSRVVEPPNCGFEKNASIMQKRVDLLLKEYQKLVAVDSTLRL